jgi:hypothetical protein
LFAAINVATPNQSAAILVGGFFKRETDAGLVEFHYSPDAELHTEQRLPAATAVADESGSSSRKAADRNLIESVDSSRAFWKTGQDDFRLLSL